MSSYGEWKNGYISDEEYSRACRMEEEAAKIVEEQEERRGILQEDLRMVIENRIPEGLCLSDIYWEDDRLIVEFEEEE